MAVFTSLVDRIQYSGSTFSSIAGIVISRRFEHDNPSPSRGIALVTASPTRSQLEACYYAYVTSLHLSFCHSVDKSFRVVSSGLFPRSRKQVCRQVKQTARFLTRL